jgi:hypothetical protein
MLAKFHDMCRIRRKSYLNFCIEKSEMSATKFPQSLIFSARIPRNYLDFSQRLVPPSPWLLLSSCYFSKSLNWLRTCSLNFLSLIQSEPSIRLSYFWHKNVVLPSAQCSMPSNTVSPNYFDIGQDIQFFSLIARKNAIFFLT